MNLLRKGKYHCTTDLLFDWLGISCFAYVELDRDLQVWSNLRFKLTGVTLPDGFTCIHLATFSSGLSCTPIGSQKSSIEFSIF